MTRLFLIISSLLLSFFLFLFVGFERVPEPTGDEARPLASPDLIQDSRERSAKRITLRIRNESCRGISTGSAFLASEKLLITNRHVIDPSIKLEANTWDGETLDLDLNRSHVSRELDIGLISLEKAVEIPSRPGSRARPGEELLVVGYPKGGALTVKEGRLKSYLAGQKLLGKKYSGEIMVLESQVKQGNSGGPVLDEEGRVVAVVFAAAIKKGKTLEAYAIPISEVLTLAQRGKKETRRVRGCS